MPKKKREKGKKGWHGRRVPRYRVEYLLYPQPRDWEEREKKEKSVRETGAAAC